MNAPQADSTPASTPGSAMEATILAIPDMATALGEIRCLTNFAHPRLLARMRSGRFDATDIAAMAVMSIVSRVGTDSTSPVDGAVPVGDCGCSTRSSVAAAMTAGLQETARSADRTPGTGQYL